MGRRRAHMLRKAVRGAKKREGTYVKLMLDMTLQMVSFRQSSIGHEQIVQR
jgi:hypothetical protein